METECKVLTNDKDPQRPWNISCIDVIKSMFIPLRLHDILFCPLGKLLVIVGLDNRPIVAVQRERELMIDIQGVKFRRGEGNDRKEKTKGERHERRGRN